MLFSVNQASHLYVVKNVAESDSVVNVGDILVKTTDDDVVLLGAQFNLYDADGTLIKFVMDGDVYEVAEEGTVEVINHEPIFCIGYIHKGGYRKDLNPVYLDYKALEDVLILIDNNFENKHIATSFIGCSSFDGNGEREKVLEFFSRLSDKNEYFIYDYEQRDYKPCEMGKNI